MRRERRSRGIGRRFVSFFLGISTIRCGMVPVRERFALFDYDVRRAIRLFGRPSDFDRAGVSLVKRSVEEKYRDRFDRTDGRGLIEMYGTVSEIRSYASSPRA